MVCRLYQVLVSRDTFGRVLHQHPLATIGMLAVELGLVKKGPFIHRIVRKQRVDVAIQHLDSTTNEFVTISRVEGHNINSQGVIYDVLTHCAGVDVVRGKQYISRGNLS
jgi:energy-converting hydrogenase Eha subunit C